MYIFFTRKIIVSTFVFFLFSCNQRGNKADQTKSFETCKIIIISPYGCINEIEFDYLGNGKFKSGVSYKINSDEIAAIDSVSNIDSFSVKGTGELKSLVDYVKSLAEKDNMQGKKADDAYHYKLFIDDTCKIDVYGGIEEIHSFFNLLIDYLPVEGDKCDFFKRYKSIKKSQTQ